MVIRKFERSPNAPGLYLVPGQATAGPRTSAPGGALIQTRRMGVLLGEI